MPIDHWLGLMHADDRALMESMIARATEEARPIDGEYRVVWPDGSLHWLAVKGEVVYDGTGRATGVTGISIDVTDRKRAEQETARAHDAALEAARSKSQFLATVSHEIRTPMNAIIGMTGLLLDSALSPTQRADAGIIRDSARYLLDLINDVLDFSRIEASRIQIRRTPFRLESCLNGVLDVVSIQAATKSLPVAVFCDEGADVVVGDAGRIRQIVLNFASNAVKFTERGSVHIRGSVSERP